MDFRLDVVEVQAKKRFVSMLGGKGEEIGGFCQSTAAN